MQRPGVPEMNTAARCKTARNKGNSGIRGKTVTSGAFFSIQPPAFLRERPAVVKASGKPDAVASR